MERLKEKTSNRVDLTNEQDFHTNETPHHSKLQLEVSTLQEEKLALSEKLEEKNKV